MSHPSSALTLVVDLGGTHVRLALADTVLPAPLLSDSIRRYDVADFGTLEEAIRGYLTATGETTRSAIIAAAGHVMDGETVQITNNPWAVSAPALRAKLGMTSIHLVNDFAAQSMAVPLLRADQLTAVGSPSPPSLSGSTPQTFVVIGPGTGLGVGALLSRNGNYSVLESEGGHAAFAAQSVEDAEILQRVRQRFGRVSNERLVCGNGLINIYLALADMAGQRAGNYSPEDITAHAAAASDALCVKSVQTMAGIFGGIAGEMVLTLGGWDGVYLTGGVLSALLPWLQRGNFRECFEAKGRFRDTMEHVPTVAMTHAEPGLLGAAALAVLESGRILTACPDGTQRQERKAP